MSNPLPYIVAYCLKQLEQRLAEKESQPEQADPLDRIQCFTPAQWQEWKARTKVVETVTLNRGE